MVYAESIFFKYLLKNDRELNDNISQVLMFCSSKRFPWKQSHMEPESLCLKGCLTSVISKIYLFR